MESSLYLGTSASKSKAKDDPAAQPLHAQLAKRLRFGSTFKKPLDCQYSAGLHSNLNLTTIEEHTADDFEKLKWTKNKSHRIEITRK